MDLRRSRWILGVVLASIAVAGTPAGADEPNFTEEQKIDFMQDAKVIISKPEKKGKSNALHLTLSDGKVTHDACFPPIDERKVHAPAPSPCGETDLNFRDYWGHPHPEGSQSGVREVSMKPTHSRICASFVHFCHDR